MYSTKNEINKLCYEILRCAIEVHRVFGSGLLESIYEKCIIFELEAYIPINSAQIISHLNLIAKPKGILINFNSTNIMKEGQKTFVTQRFADLPDGY